MKCQLLIVVWLYLLTTVNAARILAILPFPSRSHFQFHRGVIQSLYDAGHQITFVSPFPTLITMPNATIIDSKTEKTTVHISEYSVFLKKEYTLWESDKFWKESGVQFCHDVLNLKQIQKIFDSEVKLYDVMIIQLLAMYECYLPLAQKLDIPVIGIAAARTWRLGDLAVGNPFNPAVLRHEYSEYSRSWNFMDRLHNLWTLLQTGIFHYLSNQSLLDKIYRQYYGPDFRLEKKISLVFINNHASFLSRPSVPNVIDIGGIHVNTASSLSVTISKFLDDAKEGVIVFSLGGVTRGSTLTTEMRNAFMNAFSRIPQKIIWKFEDPLENVPSNVLLMKWLPQRDVLAHKNVKAFISHCGMAGTYEAISAAVPLILMPLFSDQLSNAAILEEKGVGVYLDLFSVTTEKVLDALNAIINDTRYASNMQSLSQTFKDRPMSPQESVVYWTEYIIRHKGAPHLRTSGADMPLYQYLMLDILAFIVVIATGVIFILIWFTKKCGQLICNMFQEQRHSIKTNLSKKKD